MLTAPKSRTRTAGMLHERPSWLNDDLSFLTASDEESPFSVAQMNTLMCTLQRLAPDCYLPTAASQNCQHLTCKHITAIKKQLAAVA